uniref:Integrase, catalytic region, zinc finger, CCHC-type, peptidase aspartic, catalytic n=1 Tax=Tanacetum cinerariifolium TaxID=118510 RepID=A0A6L2JQD5_TANCI|nr:integrase, catalytic region, zinc finger, CCHC-type, peptidase aspartic, catalytic [Tanacetum cinerariifolium]
MANLSEDIQCAGSDTRPPMLDMTNFASWKQRIIRYCRGKENGVNILKSIDEGPYQMGTVREPLAEGTEGAPQLDTMADVNVNAPASQPPTLAPPESGTSTHGKKKETLIVIPSKTRSDPDSPASKAIKTSKKPKPTAPKAQPRPSVSKPVSSTQPEPTSAPAKPQGKKRKLTTEISDKPSKSTKSRRGFVSKKHKPINTLRRTSTPTGSFRHDEPSSLYAKLGLSDSEEESQEVVPRADAGGQGEDQARPDPDREHMDLDVADVSPQPPPEQLDEGFTATAYPKVQENLKLTVEEQVHLEEPASSSGTLSSLQHLTKDLSFGDLFFSDKPSEADNDKATADPSLLSTAEAMMIKRIGKHEHIMANLIQENKGLEQRLESHGARLYTLEQLDIPHQKSINHDHSKELAKDLAEARKKKKKSRESPKTPPGSPPYQPPPPPPPAGPSGALGSFGASGSSQVSPPPPPPPSTNQEGPSKGSAVPSSSKTAASVEYQAWMMTDIRLRPSISLTLADLQMDEDMALDEQAQSSDDEDIRNAHILKASTLASNYSPHPEDSLLAQTECHKLLTDTVDDSILRHNVSKPLPLGGPPGQVTIQSDFFFNKDLEYLRYGSKGSRPTLSISKMKAAYYPDVGLEQMVPNQIWINEECKYDIAAMYGISHWWFQRKRFYIDRHISKGDRSAVRTHMRILSVGIIEVFSMYGYDYMKKIVLHRADLNEHVIVKRDFKVKEFKINRMNPGLNTRFWTRKDVDRSKAFMFAIQKRLKTRRIFRNLESFVGGRVRDGDYILLKRTE